MKIADLSLGNAGKVAQRAMNVSPEQLRTFGGVLGPPEQWPRELRAAVSTLLVCPMPMFLGWGSDLRFLPNEAALDALGSLATNGIGRPLRSAFAPAWSRIGPFISEAQNGAGCRGEDVFLTLNRSGKPAESWWDLVCTPFSNDGTLVAGVICLLRDTTDAVAQKHAREGATAKLRAALAAGDKIGTWDWDVANDRLRSETTFALFYGVDPDLAKKGVRGDAYLSCIHPDDRTLLEQRVVASIRTGESFYCEYRLIGASGQTHWISAQGSPEYDDNGQCVRFPGISFDITLNKLREGRRRSGV